MGLGQYEFDLRIEKSARGGTIALDYVREGNGQAVPFLNVTLSTLASASAGQRLCPFTLLRAWQMLRQLHLVVYQCIDVHISRSCIS